jgi:hypothetical protein
VNRDQLEAVIWRVTPRLEGDTAGRAMDALLGAVDAYARGEARRMLAERDRRVAAGLFAPDDPGLTAARRRVLAEVPYGRAVVA